MGWMQMLPVQTQVGVADRRGKTKKRRKKWPSMEEFEFGV